MNIKHLACFAALAAPVVANADTLSLSVGGGAWNVSPTGNFQKTTDTIAVDVENDLFWDEESQGYLFITLEHPIPIIPNVRLMQTKIDNSGSGAATFTFDGQPFTGNVSNDFSLEMTDIIAYYEILDNVVSFDLGLSVRQLKIDYNIVETTTPSVTTDSVSETIPMVYALLGGSPWPDLTISGEISYVTFEGSTISDITAKIAYTTNFFVGFEAGVRKLSIELDDASGTDADLEFDGVFAGAYVKF